MSGHRRGVRGCRRASDAPGSASLPLDALSASARASLRACWWTRQLLSSFAGPTFDATHLYDQSGNGKTLTSAAAFATATDGGQTSLVFNSAVPNTMSRADALGLSADPALTIVWQMRLTGSYALPLSPELLALGTSLAPEINIFFHDNPAVSDVVELTDSTGVTGINWRPALGSLASWNKFVLTKRGGVGYLDTAIALTINGVAPPVGTAFNGALALGSGVTQLGDYDGGGFPFDGHVAGMLVFESVLSSSDLAIVQAL